MFSGIDPTIVALAMASALATVASLLERPAPRKRHLVRGEWRLNSALRRKLTYAYLARLRAKHVAR